MIRPTRSLLAGLAASIAWAPVWTGLAVVGPAVLRAQDGSSSRASHSAHSTRASASETSADTEDTDTDTDSDTASDDASDRVDVKTAPSHSGGGARGLEVARMFRPGRDTSALLHVDVSYGAGSLSLMPAPGPWLYDVHMDYVPTTKEAPQVLYDSTARTLRVSGTSHGDMEFTIGDHHGSHTDQELQLGLGRAVPLDLSLTFGAGDVTAQLGGLSVKRLKVETGASDATLAFNAADPIPLDELAIKVGAAGFQAIGLGNAHVRHMVLQAVAGNVDLDFGGQWTGDATLDIQAAVGAVHIHVPRDVAVDQSSKVIIGSTGSGPGAATPRSPGAPTYRLHVKSTTTLGSLEFDRKTRE